MDVSLTPELQAFVNSELQSGIYQSESELICAALSRLLSDKKPRLPELPETLEELEAQLLESLAAVERGEGTGSEETFRWLRERMAATRPDA